MAVVYFAHGLGCRTGLPARRRQATLAAGLMGKFVCSHWSVYLGNTAAAYDAVRLLDSNAMALVCSANYVLANTMDLFCSDYIRHTTWRICAHGHVLSSPCLASIVFV